MLDLNITGNRSCPRRRRWIAAAWILWICILPLHGQTAPAPSIQQIQQLASSGQWETVVDRVGNLPSVSPDMSFYLGSALAHLGRLAEADRALHSGQRAAPSDPRFLTERAGIAFKLKQYPKAVRLLRQGLRLAPADPYASDFLGTVYFLEDNLPAALKYWNRVGKPDIAQVREDPVPRVSPALLDQAFTFSPAARLTSTELLDSQQRLRGLGIFAQQQFDLRALPDGTFDVSFRNQEKNGLGDTKLQAVVLLASDLPFQGVSSEYDNLAHRAANIRFLIRWDAEKRRFLAEFSSPLDGSATLRYTWSTDLRNENWALRNSFTGLAPVLARVNLRREGLRFVFASLARDRFGWQAGAELSHRDFRSVVPGDLLTAALLAPGNQLTQMVKLETKLLRVPEQHLTVDAAVTSQAARLWSQSGQSWEKLQAALGWHWLPQASGDDYALEERIRAGRTFGQAPFDELFMLGLERDNDLPMHAHIGTRDGRKGSAPLGRNYVLNSWEQDKNLYSNGLVTLKLGPLVDAGKITDPGTTLGSRQWLVDLGAQLKVRLFSTTVALSYGRDLRTGNNAFYAALEP
jgi:Tetratricopeptide repeat